MIWLTIATWVTNVMLVIIIVQLVKLRKAINHNSTVVGINTRIIRNSYDGITYAIGKSRIRERETGIGERFRDISG